MAVKIGTGKLTGRVSTINLLQDAWGIAMQKGKPKGGRKLAMRITYERSRLSADCLIQAYERLVPVARSSIVAAENLTPEAARVQPARRR